MIPSKKQLFVAVCGVGAGISMVINLIIMILFFPSKGAAIGFVISYVIIYFCFKWQFAEDKRNGKK